MERSFPDVIVNFKLNEDDYLLFNKFTLNNRYSRFQFVLIKVFFSFLASLAVFGSLGFLFWIMQIDTDNPALLIVTPLLMILFYFLSPKIWQRHLKSFIKKHPEKLDSSGRPFHKKQLILSEDSLSVNDGTATITYSLSKIETLYCVNGLLIFYVSKITAEVIPLNRFSEVDQEACRQFFQSKELTIHQVQLS